MSSQYEYLKLHWLTNWRCNINSKYVTSYFEYHLKDQIYKSQMKQHLITKKNYTSESIENIDWFAIGKAASSISMRRRMWVTKFVSGFYDVIAQATTVSSLGGKKDCIWCVPADSQEACMGLIGKGASFCTIRGCTKTHRSQSYHVAAPGLRLST